MPVLELQQEQSFKSAYLPLLTVRFDRIPLQKYS